MLDIDKIKDINKNFFKNNLDEIVFSQTLLQKNKNLENLNFYAKKNNLSLKVLDQRILKLKSDLDPQIFLRDIKLEDLIERTVEYKNNVNLEEIENKCILVTGAAGSIGSELATRILAKKPEKLVLLDFSEINMFKLRDLLIKKAPKEITKVDFLLLNLNDEEEINSLFDRYNFDFVYHAAAYKHVPLVEDVNNIKLLFRISAKRLPNFY